MNTPTQPGEYVEWVNGIPEGQAVRHLGHVATEPADPIISALTEALDSGVPADPYLSHLKRLAVLHLVDGEALTTSAGVGLGYRVPTEFDEFNNLGRPADPSSLPPEWQAAHQDLSELRAAA